MTVNTDQFALFLIENAALRKIEVARSTHPREPLVRYIWRERISALQHQLIKKHVIREECPDRQSADLLEEIHVLPAR